MPNDPIKHIVLLMLENHSFDQMLGCFQARYPGLDGIDPNAPARANLDDNGQPVFQHETRQTQMYPDPKHETENVLEQLKDNNGGFVRDFQKAYPSYKTAAKEIMGYYPLDFLPALHSLAGDFTICDQWFSSLPGPTWPNRFFALSGTSSGRTLMPEGFLHPALSTITAQTQKTIFDRLNEAGVSWKIYYYDFPSSLIFANQREPGKLAHYTLIDEFYKDCKNEAAFPRFSFIEPKYFGLDQNDDHPPHNIFKGEKLIADVYNGLRSNEELWHSTLLVILYDEHGGFYDHVSPPEAVQPDNHTEEYGFDRLGVRVPALLVSPWVKKGVESTKFDHTSLLRYMIEKWDLGPLGNRAAQANSIPSNIWLPAPRTDTIPFIRVPYTNLIPQNPDWERMDSSKHHEALHLFANYLHEKLDQETGVVLEKVALAAGLWMRGKAWIGGKLLQVGERLIQGLLDYNHSRFLQTKNVLRRLMDTRR